MNKKPIKDQLTTLANNLYAVLLEKNPECIIRTITEKRLEEILYLSYKVQTSLFLKLQLTLPKHPKQNLKKANRVEHPVSTPNALSNSTRQKHHAAKETLHTSRLLIRSNNTSTSFCAANLMCQKPTTISEAQYVCVPTMFVA